MSQDNAVTVVTAMGFTVQGSNPSRGKIFVSFPGHPASYSMGTRILFQG
jgi:hypothetical protein